jgi:hypothetical protein
MSALRVRSQELPCVVNERAYIGHQLQISSLTAEIRVTAPLLYFPFTLRLYGYVLTCLRDHNFSGLDVFYRVKDCWKGRDTPSDLLLRPLERGLSVKIGEWCFQSMFDADGQGAQKPKPYYKELGKEDFLWFLEDVVEAASLSGFFEGEALLDAIATRINEIDTLFATDEAAYWDQVERDGRRKLTRMFLQFCQNRHASLVQMGNLYAYEVGDRILHDRELCHFIARTVMEIGFAGETVEGMRSQWVERERWPSRIKEILRARDRGECAACGLDIVQELREEGHIDHMFPLARGGCNDLVNLQLLCSPCNRRKLDRADTPTTSVPRYIRRPRRPQDSAKT